MEDLGHKHCRYEKKFLVSGMTVHEAEMIVKLHPAFFSGVYNQRYINNIYFDTHDHKSYHDSVDGVSERVKVRIRWYGELFNYIEKPVLEIKEKNGLLGYKRTFILNSFSMDKDINKQSITNVIKESNIPGNVKFEISNMSPILMNRYIRSYFLSSDGRYRITIDSNMVFYDMLTAHRLVQGKTGELNIIVELKYNYVNGHFVDNITNHFPFRMTKSSKYVTAFGYIVMGL